MLDRAQDGLSAEKALTAWGRSNRYAGSKDRAAVRDHVYDVLRQKRSLGYLGGGTSARALVLGLLRSQNIDPGDIFGIGGYSPDALSSDEAQLATGSMDEAVALDLPDWLWPIWATDLGCDAAASARCLQSRAPIALRVNLRRGSVAAVQAALAGDDIETQTIDAVSTALFVTQNARRLRLSKAFTDGLFDLQDVSSQEAVAGLSIPNGARVLDYCAGGGGKALALADMHDATITAHDVAPERTVDILPRADRAGVKIDVIRTEDLTSHAPFDVVFCDAPCSGSGTWRRTPESKWALTGGKLNNFSSLQADVISKAASFVVAGGNLVYATCSVLRAENNDVIDAFLVRHPSWVCVTDSQRLPDLQGDGFFYAVLHKT
ncbi:MAG: 16S rRNA (cytosine967-C5)-methyltransferase [Yoonia sp.]